jgi:hypothetical protein
LTSPLGGAIVALAGGKGDAPERSTDQGPEEMPMTRIVVAFLSLFLVVTSGGEVAAQGPPDGQLTIANPR